MISKFYTAKNNFL